MDIGNTIKDAFFGKGPWLTIGDVEVTGSMAEKHGYEAEKTEFPVEKGAKISDHYRKLSRKVSISGKISNIPLATGFPGQTLYEAFKNIKTDNNAISAWQTIGSYFDESRLITIVTSLQTYENMALMSFSVDRDGTTKDTLVFTCDAEEMRIVSTETTGAISEVKVKKAKSKSVKEKKADQKGNQQTKEATGQQKQSMLDKGFGSFF